MKNPSNSIQYWPSSKTWKKMLKQVGVTNIPEDQIEAFMLNNMKKLGEEYAFIQKHHRQFQQLSKRERQILSLVAKGFSNPQIADRLYISRNTVEQHRKNINRKLQTNQLAVLIRYARAFELL